MMRFGALMLLLVATLFGGVYWYTHTHFACNTPIHYRIGDIDSRFNTTAKELVRIAENATAVWEKPLGEELFVYDDSETSIPINLIFDERQKNADLEIEIKEDLAAKAGMSQSVATQYEELITEFRKIKKNYEASVVAYEEKLKSYNATVTSWNKKGGAPDSVIKELSITEKELTNEQHYLQQLATKLNELVTQLNVIGAQGNSLVTDYNTIVNQYNQRFAEGGEFTQGDYTSGNAIDVYQFDSEDELTVVLAHEFGHSLSLNHVENKESVMYHTMEAQTLTKGITSEDRSEFVRVCANKNIAFSFLKAVASLF